MFQLKAALVVSIVLAQVSTPALAGVDTLAAKAGDPTALCAQEPDGPDKITLNSGANKGIVVVDGVEPDDSGNGAFGEVDGKPGIASGSNGSEARAIKEVDRAVASTNSGIIVYGKDNPSPKTNRPAASNVPASPGAAVGFNPQPDPPGKGTAAATSCHPQVR